MQNNYYFLRQLTKSLQPKLVGLRLMECFSQEKDELVLGFAVARGKKRNYKEFFIKAVLFPDFACLYFPEQFERARKNSVDLFSQIIDLEVINIKQFENERCFAIEFEANFTLLFKLYGNRSNIILFQNDEVIDLFHSRIIADNKLKISQLDRFIDQSSEALAATDDYKKVFPTFGKLVNHYIESNELPSGAVGGLVTTLLSPTYYIARFEHQLHLSLLPIGEVIREFDDPIEAINHFYVNYNKSDTLGKEKGQVLRKLSKEKSKPKPIYKMLINALN